MCAVVVTGRGGAVGLAGPPRWHGSRRAAGGAVWGFAPRVVGPACVVASCVSLQTGAALATSVFAVFGPAGTGALRFLAAAVVLLLSVRPGVRGRSGMCWLVVTALGAAMAATNFCVYEAIARIPLGMAGTLVFLGPLCVALLRARRRLDLVWAAVAGLGVVLLTRGLSGGSVLGVALAFGAAAGVVASILLMREVGERTTGLDGLALSVAVAAVLTLPVGVPAALDATGARDLAIVGGVGVLAIAVPYALELTALRRVGAKTYSILLSLDPAVAGLAGLVLLGQRLGPAEIAGIALVMAASTGAVATREG